MWEAMVECIRRSAKEILGKSRRGGNNIKRAWWWNEKAKDKVKEKKKAYGAFMNSRIDEENEASRVRYKAAKKVAKKVVTTAKSMAYARVYRKLETKEGKKEVFKLTKVRERRIRDLGALRCIKYENSKMLFEDPEIKERWQRYLSKLLNGEMMEDF